MGFQVVYSDHFRQKLNRLMACSGGLYTQETLRNLMAQIVRSKDHLSLNPRLGAIEPLLETEEPQFRHIVIRPYFKLIYFVHNQDVVLATIWDVRQNPDALVAELNER